MVIGLRRCSDVATFLRRGSENMKLIREMARAMIARRGYSYYKDEYAPYGIKPFNDIRRLSRRLDYPIETFFDVGANIGQTAVEALASFPSASIICFEPHPTTFDRLSRRMAQEQRVAVHRLAL